MKKKLIGNVVLSGDGKKLLSGYTQSMKNHIDYILSNYYYIDIYNNITNDNSRNKIINQYIDYFRCNKIMCQNYDLKQLKNKLKTKDIEFTQQQIADIIIKPQYKKFFQNNYAHDQLKQQFVFQQFITLDYRRIKKIYIHPFFYKNHNYLFQKCKIPYRQFFLNYNNIPCILDRNIQNKQKIYVVNQ